MAYFAIAYISEARTKCSLTRPFAARAGPLA
jgi:hypothetical protein